MEKNLARRILSFTGCHAINAFADIRLSMKATLSLYSPSFEPEYLKVIPPANDCLPIPANLVSFC